MNIFGRLNKNDNKSDRIPNELESKIKISREINSIDKSINEICNALSSNTNSFDKKFTYHLLREYFKNDTNRRIRYSTVSDFIFKCNQDEKVYMLNNIETLYKFISEMHQKKSDDETRRIKKIVFKLWDHISLATSQFSALKDKKADLDANFNENFNKERVELINKIDESSKLVTSQLISMVAIFTAMAFLVFGGLNSLSDILSASIQGVPVLNISIVCLLWGLCVYNMIYLFMYLVSKIINKNIASRASKHIFRRHLIYFTGNLVLLLMLWIVGWLYFVKCDFHGWYSALYKNFTGFTPYIGLVVIAIVIIITIVFYFLIRKHDKEEKQ